MTNNTTAVIPTRNPTSETAGKTASTTLPITGSDPKNIWTAISAAIGPVELLAFGGGGFKTIEMIAGSF
jgi:hypothetical protein